MRALSIAAKLNRVEAYSAATPPAPDVGHTASLCRCFSPCIAPPNATRLPPPIQCKDFPQLWKTCGLSDRYRLPPSMNLWRQVLDRLEQVVEKTEYDTWFAPTRFLARKGDTVDIGVPSQRYIEEVRERYGAQIRS